MHSTKIAEQVGALLKDKGLKIVTAESCTGGLLSGALTSIAGSSAWFERGFVTYSNESKQEILGVHQHALRVYGAVSEIVAEQMAKGALVNSLADMAISITGIAGPDGGTADKPVGLVWFGIAKKTGESSVFFQRFAGNRTEIRLSAVQYSLEQLLRAIE
jgi:nicotinamide-nucleotide amidase